MLHFIVHNWMLIASYHECFSIIFICILRLDEPYEWPPIYGNLLEAYTVRRFWAHFLAQNRLRTVSCCRG